MPKRHRDAFRERNPGDPLDRVEVAGLIDALRDDAAQIRIAVLKALVLLNLAADVWGEVSRHVLTALASPSAGGMRGAHRLTVIELATRIPVGQVERRLAELADSDDADEARAALEALVTIRAPAAVPPLCKHLANDDPGVRRPAAEHLARLDVTVNRNELRQLAEADYDAIVRFWLSVALAGIGEPGSLKELFAQFHRDEITFGLDEETYEWLVFRNQVRACGPFTQDVAQQLRRLRSSARRRFTRTVLGDLLGLADRPRPDVGTFLGNPLPPSRERTAPATRDTEDWLLESLVETLAAVWPTEYRECGPGRHAALVNLDRAAAGLLVSALFDTISAHSATTASLVAHGNAIVRLVGLFRKGIAPDAKALFQSYRSVYDVPVEHFPFLRWQIAWVASWAPMRAVLGAANALLLGASDAQTRLAAATFVEEVARYEPEPIGPLFGGGVPPPDRAGHPYDVVRIFYATDRNWTGRERPGRQYGSRRGDLTFGTCDVSIPRGPMHSIGALETPSIIRLEFRANPRKHVIVQEVVQLSARDFLAQLKDRLDQSMRKEILVFVHGFNVSFEEGARRTAQIAYDLGFSGAPLLYSWPSQGKLSLSGYRHDANNVTWSVPHLRKVLADLAAISGAAAIYLIAHSMGNQALTAALKDIATDLNAEELPAFTEVVLTAPDIDADVFRAMARQFASAAKRVTLYASASDQALKFSKRYQGNYPRAGDTGAGVVIVPGVDTIDVSAVDTTFIGHFYYASNKSVLSDLFYLIGGMPVSKRFGVTATRGAGGPYWVFKP